MPSKENNDTNQKKGNGLFSISQFRHLFSFEEENAVKQKYVGNKSVSGSLLFFSSGTIRQKLLVYPFAEIDHAIRTQVDTKLFDPPLVYALTLPLNHVGGLSILFRCMMVSGEICVFLRKNKRDFIKRISSRAFSRNLLTHASMTPYQLRSLLEKKENSSLKKVKKIRHLNDREKKSKSETKSKSYFEKFDELDFRLILIGGGPIPRWIWDICKKKNIKNKMILPSYGLSESFGLLGFWVKNDEKTSKNIFVTLLGREVKVDSNGELLLGKRGFFFELFGRWGEYTEKEWQKWIFFNR